MSSGGLSQASLNNLRLWERGETGNPLGLTSKYRLAIRKCRIASPQMAQRLIDCANDTSAPWASRVAAAVSVLDRAWGKPKETVELSNENGVPMLSICFVAPDGSEQRETLTLTQAAEPELGPALEQPGVEAGFQLSFGKRK